MVTKWGNQVPFTRGVLRNYCTLPNSFFESYQSYTCLLVQLAKYLNTVRQWGCFRISALSNKIPVINKNRLWANRERNNWEKKKLYLKLCHSGLYTATVNFHCGIITTLNKNLIIHYHNTALYCRLCPLLLDKKYKMSNYECHLEGIWKPKYVFFTFLLKSGKPIILLVV